MDTTAPIATITTGSNSPAGTAKFNVTFSEPVTNVTANDFSLTGNLAANKVNSTAVVQIDSSHYTVTVTYSTSGTLGKTLGLNLNSGTDVIDIAGNVAPAVTGPLFSSLAPAGVAGEPINLALADPSNHVGLVTLSINGVPAGWTLSAGIRNADGSWTVQTYDPSNLSITTDVGFVGAMVLGVNMSWTNADGSTGTSYIANNIEAFSPGSAIFAVSADDHLTGSSGADTFVFAQPIATDIIHNFNASADKIDLIGFSATQFGDLSIANDISGSAVVTLGSGASITLLGVDATLLGASNFEFNVEPVTSNSGIISIADGAILPIGGMIVNTGTIELNSVGSETDLEILFQGATLTGAGKVILSDNSHNLIFGGTADTLLHNVDNTISGAGQIGAGQLTLNNAGTINATGNNALVIDTGIHLITNTGTLEATGSGGLIVNSDLYNIGGLLWAHGGNVILNGVVQGGSAALDGTATLEFGSTVSADIILSSNATGTIKLDNATGFSGSVTGLNMDDVLDLGNLLFSDHVTVGYASNAAGSGGMLSVSDGTHISNVNLIGQYSLSGFHLSMDATGGTLVTNDHPLI